MITIKFFVDEYDLTNASAEGQAIHLSFFLTDVMTTADIERVQSEIKSALARQEFWDHSYNKTYLEVSADLVRCGDLFEEESYIELQHDRFNELLAKWKLFVNNPGGSPINVTI